MRIVRESNAWRHMQKFNPPVVAGQPNADMTVVDHVGGEATPALVASEGDAAQFAWEE